MARSGPIRLGLLTGFLGAGKTTLLNRLLKDPSLSETAVIINEFGEVSIDHLLVSQASDGIVELGGGCLCCTVRGELVDRLAELAQSERELRRVIVETTGLADPGPIIQAVMAHPELARIYRLDAVVTVVDAVNGPATLDAYEEARHQVALADRLVLSKADMASEEQIRGLRRRLAAFNPHTDLFDAREIAAVSLFEGLAPRKIETAEASHRHHDHDHGHSHGEDGFQSVSLLHDRPLPWSAIENFLDLLATQQGDNILRIKGLIETKENPDRPVLVQGAQKILHLPETLPSWPDDERGTRIVVIGKGLDTDYVRRIFTAFAGRPAVDTPDRSALEENPLAISGFRP